MRREVAPLAARLRQRSLGIFPALLLLFVLTSCGRKPDPVVLLVGRVRDAAEARDADAISRELAEDFEAGNGQGRAELKAELSRMMAAYATLRVSLSDVMADRGTGLAHVTLRAALAGTPRAAGGAEAYLPRTAAYRFDLRLVERDGRFRITKAAWSSE